MNNSAPDKKEGGEKSLKEKIADVVQHVPPVGPLLAAVAKAWGLKELGFVLGGFLLAVVLLYFGKLPASLTSDKVDDMANLAGLWTWQYAEEGMRSELNFRVQSGNLVFDGTLFEKGQPRYRITHGNAWLRPRGLDLQCTAEDLKTGAELRWETVEPLVRGLSFSGTFRSEYTKHPDFPLTNWGIAIYKPVR